MANTKGLLLVLWALPPTAQVPNIVFATGFIDIVQGADGGSVGLLGVFGGCEYVSSTTGETVFSNFTPVLAQIRLNLSKHLSMITQCKRLSSPQMQL